MMRFIEVENKTIVGDRTIDRPTEWDGVLLPSRAVADDFREVGLWPVHREYVDTPKKFVLDTDRRIVIEVVSLDEIKQEMREKAKELRQEHGTKPVTYDGNSFQADGNSQQKIQGAIERARAYNANNSDEWSTQWKLADNTFTEITQSGLEAVFALVADQVEAAYNREAEITGDISAATTTRDLNAIDVTAGWP